MRWNVISDIYDMLRQLTCIIGLKMEVRGCYTILLEHQIKTNTKYYLGWIEIWNFCFYDFVKIRVEDKKTRNDKIDKKFDVLYDNLLTIFYRPSYIWIICELYSQAKYYIWLSLNCRYYVIACYFFVLSKHINVCSVSAICEYE